MPRKKKSELGRVTSKAKKERNKRSLESESQRQERLEKLKICKYNLKRSETQEHRNIRLNADRQQHSIKRKYESNFVYEKRLKCDNQHHAEMRANEAEDHRTQRLARDREHHTDTRENETDDHRNQRLARDREHHTDTRENETEDHRTQRLARDREHHNELLENETEDHQIQRLARDREHHAELRENETEDHRIQRLERDCEHHVELRENETEDQRTLRLAHDREHHAELREDETEDHRIQRLARDSEYHAELRENETDDEYTKRLQRNRIQTSLSRSSESEAHHEERLRNARKRYNDLKHQNEIHSNEEQARISYMRDTQSSDERLERLRIDRQQHTLFRQLQTENEYQNRLTNDRSRHAEQHVLQWKDKIDSGFSYSPSMNYKQESEIGSMSYVCENCNALKWKGESKGLCCSSGKIVLNSIPEPPEPLQSLLLGHHIKSTVFFKYLRNYNNAFQMTSFGANIINEGNFMPTFKIQGQVYHLISSVYPENNTVSKFLQIYFLTDYNTQANTRMTHIHNLDKDLILDLQNMIFEVNPYIKDFKSALESIPPNDQDKYKLVINADLKPASSHPGCFNQPTTNEVAALLIDQQCERRDIVLSIRQGGLKRVCETHRAYDALQYPLMFCRGEDGYSFNQFQVNSEGEKTNKKISALQFYCYRLMVRNNESNHLHRYRQVFNQYLVDMYAKIETERLSFLRNNQKQLRAENYIHLKDALQHDENFDNLGRLVILPSSFTGGRRYMHERTQDAFCYVRKYGRPDLFITFTTNPKWEEITKELYEGQSSSDRQDIISRVFHLKLKKLIDLLTKGKIFGSVKCYIFTVEWQKRGLPHAHILLWLDKTIQNNDVDKVIQAEFPKPQEDKELYNIIKIHMVHGPCGMINSKAPCMKNGCCSKHFPKPFVNETIHNENGYPSYRRRSPENGGFTAQINVHGKTVEVDNRWVVPYSPVLSSTFEAHINVEYCCSVKSIKYICKYINKGSDQATFGFKNERDEIIQYQSGRYISTSEAVWRILSYPIHERFPPVVHLDVHLENGQRVYFNTDNVIEKIDNPKNTTLMAFFQLCQTDSFAKTLLYCEVPEYYIFEKQCGMFKRRKRGQPVDGRPQIVKEHVIGRVYTIHPGNTECYYLRLLLHTVRGPTSFEALKTIDNITYPTFQAVCKVLNLTENDSHWNDTLEDAVISDSPSKLRQLFSIILVFCNPSDPNELWEKFKKHLYEDYGKNLVEQFPDVDLNLYVEEFENRCLTDLQNIVLSIGEKDLDFYGLPMPQNINNPPRNREYLSETSYNRSFLNQFIVENEIKLNADQKKILNTIISSVNQSKGDIFFIDAPGGTGKTFLINLILAKVRNNGKIALAVASSGIAATLLPGGKTAHSMFKIPIDLNNTENPLCNISKNSDKAKVLQDTCLVVWDECTMANKTSIEALDRTLQDLRSNTNKMGGITFLFSGDFRQTLPVIHKGTRADEVNASIKNSYIWNKVKKLSLRINMRVQHENNLLAANFSNLLIKIGEGTVAEENNEILLSSELCNLVFSIDELINKVYPDIKNIFNKDKIWFSERTILCPKNDAASSINNSILEKFQSEEIIYKSFNTTLNQDEATNYPIEFLDSLNCPGLPEHVIKLKVGVPIILMRNLNPPNLCNGTRLIVTKLQANIIEATIITGSGIGESVFIPRIPIIPNNYPFQFKRVQFPVCVCFAMTINKSQGQTMKIVGVDLRNPCFSHGQLYVALSRVRSPEDVFVCAHEGKTRNIVYYEALK